MAPQAKAEPGTAPGTELSRDLGMAQATLMGIGTMLGAGVFVGIGTALSRVGAGGLLLVLALNGLLAMLSAMSYAELASSIPRAGGAHNFARVALGRAWGFVAGWVEWCGEAVAGSLYASALALYVLGFLAAVGALPWEHHSGHIAVRLLALAVVTVVALVSARGASLSGRLGALITVALLGGVGVVGALGLVTLLRHPARLANFEPFAEGGSVPVLATMSLVYVVFQGYTVISQAGDEVAEPRRTLPRAILLAALVASLAYLLAAVGAVAAVGALELGPASRLGRWGVWLERRGGPDTFFAVAVTRLLPSWGPLLAVGVVVCAALAALNAVLFAATRVLYAMGRDRVLPGAMARLSRRTRTPWVALLATWLAMALIVWTAPTLTEIASLTSIMFLLLFLLVNFCCLRVRRRMGDELHYGYVMPLFPAIPLLAIAGNACLVVGMAALSPGALAAGVIWLLLGVLLYAVYGKRHAIGTRDEIISFRDTSAPASGGFCILLPVGNPDEALDKVLVTMRLAQVHQAEVELLHMVPIPDQVPLADAERYMDVGKEAMAEAMIYLASRCPLRETIRYCRNPARGILSAARDHEAKLIILGWRGQASGGSVRFGTTLDPILERTPCDVIVLRDCKRLAYRDILVPFAGGPNSLLSLRLASILLDPEGGVIRPFTVNLPGQQHPSAAEFIERHAEQFVCSPERFQPEVRESRDLVGSLVEAGRSADLIVVGASRSLRVPRLGGTPVAEALARQLPCALAMVKAPSPVTSLLNRWV